MGILGSKYISYRYEGEKPENDPIENITINIENQGENVIFNLDNDPQNDQENQFN